MTMSSAKWNTLLAPKLGNDGRSQRPRPSGERVVSSGIVAIRRPGSRIKEASVGSSQAIEAGVACPGHREVARRLDNHVSVSRRDSRGSRNRERVESDFALADVDVHGIRHERGDVDIHPVAAHCEALAGRKCDGLDAAAADDALALAVHGHVIAPHGVLVVTDSHEAGGHEGVSALGGDDGGGRGALDLGVVL